jgi:flagellin-like hook-associated protein FlgL
LTAASATIKKGEVAEEIAELTRQQLLVQFSVAVVGQANLVPEGVLFLLQQ